MKGYIHSTESFGTVDGPGVRFVIFFQGCPMRCLYCHNPDTWTIGGGTETDTGTLLAEFNKSREFYRSGGITCTGGEPMLQMPFLTELFTQAKAQGIHTCLDTSGICYDPAQPAPAETLLAVTDLVMLDIKHIDDGMHRRLTGHSNARILAFAQKISEMNVPLWIRHVIVPGWTDSADEQARLGWFIGGLHTLKAVDVLPYHNMGRRKYEALGLPYPLGDTPPVTQDAAAAAKEQIMQGIRRRLREG